MGEEIAAQLPNGIGGKAVGAKRHQPLEQGADGNGCRQNDGNLSEGGEIYLVRPRHAVHCLTDEHRHKQGEPRSDEGKEQHSHHFFPAGLCIR